jgi:hypothetical protein
MAGEVVKVRASGSFRVGSWYGESLSPTAHSGALRVGLNDSDLDNNEGLVSFEVELRAPTAEEWLGGGELTWR